MPSFTKPPKPPDPKETAAAQTSQSVNTAIANAFLTNADQVTPWGGLTYTPTTLNKKQQNRVSRLEGRLDNDDLSDAQRSRIEGRLDNIYGRVGFHSFTDPNSGDVHRIPRFTVEQTLTPEQERLNEIGQGTQENLAKIGRDQSARIGDLLGDTIDVDGLPQGGDAGSLALNGEFRRELQTDWSEDRKRVEDALMARINPQLDRDRESLRARLLSQGINEGSEAFDRAMSRANEASTDARMRAILAGGAEQTRLANLDLSAAQLNNNALLQEQGANATAFNAAEAARARALNEQFSLRNAPINEITALMSGSQVTTPRFAPTSISGMPTTDVAGITMGANAAEMGAYNANMGLIGDIGGGVAAGGGAVAGGIGAAGGWDDFWGTSGPRKVG